MKHTTAHRGAGGTLNRTRRYRWYDKWWANWLYPVALIWVLVAPIGANQPWLYHCAVNYRNSLLTVFTYAWLHITVSYALNNALIGVVCATIIAKLLRYLLVAYRDDAGVIRRISNAVPLFIWLIGSLSGGLVCYIATAYAHTQYAVLGASIGLATMVGFAGVATIHLVARHYMGYQQPGWGRLAIISTALLAYMATVLMTAPSYLTFMVHLLGLGLGMVLAVGAWLWAHTQEEQQ